MNEKLMRILLMLLAATLLFTIAGGIPQPDPDPGAPTVANPSSTPVTMNSPGSWKFLKVYVYGDATELRVIMTGPDCVAPEACHDADLYVRVGNRPNGGAYNCRPLLYGNNENCIFANPAQGWWYIGVDHYTTEPGSSSFQNTVTVSHDGINKAPVSDFVATPLAAPAATTINFDAASAIDSDGVITLYEWDFNGDGTYDDSSAAATTTNAYATPGSYRVALRTTDDEGVTHVLARDDYITIWAPPVAFFSSTPAQVIAGQQATFTDGSSAGDGSLAAWNWNFPGGSPNMATGPGPHQISYSTPGNLPASLTITDANGLSDTFESMAEVRAPLPAAAFTATTTTINAGGSVTFSDDSNSYGNIMSYDWEFPGGTPAGATGPGPHDISYAASGTFDVTLSIVDQYGGFDQAQEIQFVQVLAGEPPEISFTWAPFAPAIGQLITFTDTSPDAVSWQWDFGNDGSIEATGATAQYTFGATGPQPVRLVIQNGAGVAASLIQTINVLETPNAQPVAVPDSYQVTEDAPLTVPAPGVLANDYDEESGVQVWSATPQHGSIQINPDGSFAYMPAANFVGTDLVAYCIVDDVMNQGCSTISMQVQQVLDAPEADFDVPSQVSPYAAGVALTFLDTTNYIDGAPSSRLWDIGGMTFTDAEPSHTFVAGSHTVKLTVTDEFGFSDSVTKTLQVTQPTLALHITSSSTKPLANTPVTFHVAGSGVLSNIVWVIDGQQHMGTPVTTQFPSAGTFTIRVQANNDAGAAGTDSLLVSVVDVAAGGSGGGVSNNAGFGGTWAAAPERVTTPISVPAPEPEQPPAEPAGPIGLHVAPTEPNQEANTGMLALIFILLGCLIAFLCIMVTLQIRTRNTKS